MSTKKKTPAKVTPKAPASKPTPPTPPTLKETSMALVAKLSNAVICGDGDAVKSVNERLDDLIKRIQEKRDHEVASIQKCKDEIARLSVQGMAHYTNIQELDRLKIDTTGALESIASLGEKYRKE